MAKIRGQHTGRVTLQNYKAFDQREIEVNLHKATTSPSNVSPASRTFLKTYMMVKISTNQIAKNRHTSIYFEYRKFLRISEILKRTCLPTHFCIDSAATENGEQ